MNKSYFTKRESVYIHLPKITILRVGQLIRANMCVGN